MPLTRASRSLDDSAPVSAPRRAFPHSSPSVPHSSPSVSHRYASSSHRPSASAGASRVPKPSSRCKLTWPSSCEIVDAHRAAGKPVSTHTASMDRKLLSRTSGGGWRNGPPHGWHSVIISRSSRAQVRPSGQWKAWWAERWSELRVSSSEREHRTRLIDAAAGSGKPRLKRKACTRASSRCASERLWTAVRAQAAHAERPSARSMPPPPRPLPRPTSRPHPWHAGSSLLWLGQYTSPVGAVTHDSSRAWQSTHCWPKARLKSASQ